MFILWKFKKSMQKSIFPQKIQKSLCITTKSLYTNSNFKRNYLENYNDSEHAVKTKNAPFFMIFPNISFFHMVVNYWTRGGDKLCSSTSEKKIFLNFCKNDFSRGNFMREIDCAHSRSVKMLPWPWFREIDVCIEAKIEKFWNFSLKILFLG